MASRQVRWRKPLVVLGLVIVVAGCSAPKIADTTVARVASAASASKGPTVGVSEPSLICPAKAPKAAPAPKGAPTSEVPVPGAPSEVLVCAYAGGNRSEPVGTLLAHRLVAHPAALADAANAGALVGPGNYSCPADDGGLALLRFGYANGTTDDVRVESSGCRWVHSQNFDSPARWTSPQLQLLLNQTVQ
jgi:hypothetical protein